MTSDTRTLLMATAETIVRRRGYAGFSYADLAAQIGIRKASIHHHFPTKEDLGLALVEAYSARFDGVLADISARIPLAHARLIAYAGLFRDGVVAGESCLCGVLAAELEGLPERLQASVRRFFELNLAWLADVLADGQRRGDIRANVTPRAQAVAVLSGLEGAMLVSQSLGSLAAFDQAAEAVLAGLWPDGATKLPTKPPRIPRRRKQGESP